MPTTRGTRAREKPSPPPTDLPDEQQWQEQRSLAERPVRCLRCGHVVTYLRETATPDGKHEHAFFNPAGIAFVIRCFRNAPGVADEGNPTSDFSWFKGYRWQIGYCRRCGIHLGWRFSSAIDVFYGLIKEKLR